MAAKPRQAFRPTHSLLSVTAKRWNSMSGEVITLTAGIIKLTLLGNSGANVGRQGAVGVNELAKLRLVDAQFLNPISEFVFFVDVNA